MAGEEVVGGIVGYLRLDADDFHREIAKALAEVKALDGQKVDVKVDVDAKAATRELDAVAKSADGVGRSVGGMNKSFKGLRDPRVIIGGIGTGLAVLGPVAGAATAALGGFVGVVGTGILAWQGFKKEIEEGTALGKTLESGLGGVKDVLSDLTATAARSMSGGVFDALATLRQELPGLNGDVNKLGTHLGDALAVSAKGLIAGLHTMMPLLQDGAQYAGVLAQKFADFAASDDFTAFVDYSRQALPEVVDMLVQLGAAAVSLGKAFAPIGDELVQSIGYIAKGINVLGKALEPVIKVGMWSPFKTGTEEAASSVNTFSTAVEHQTDVTSRLQPVIDRQAASWGVTSAALEGARAAQQSHKDAAMQAMVAMQLENDAAGILKTTLDGLNGEALTAAQAQNAFESSLVNMGTHVDKTGKKITFTTSSISNMSSASVALRGQLNGQVANLQRVVEANGGLENSTGKARAQMKSMRQQIIDNAVAHGVDREAVTKYIDKILAIPKKVPPTKLDVDNKAGLTGIAAFQRAIDNLSGKTVGVHTRYTYSGTKPTGGRSTKGGSTFDADGSIKFYASGGIESHVAQIAPAGAMRVWAEPETGGEAYIPLAKTKRARSERILAETNRLMGDPLGASNGVQVIVHPAPGQSEYAIGMAAANALEFKLRSA